MRIIDAEYNSLNDLKKKFKKVCLNAYSTKDSKGRCQIYKRKDFCEWSMEAYERGEDYFYADPVNPVNPYGKHKLCEPRYAYELMGMLSKEEYEELFGVVSKESGDKENDEKEE